MATPQGARLPYAVLPAPAQLTTVALQLGDGQLQQVERVVLLASSIHPAARVRPRTAPLRPYLLVRRRQRQARDKLRPAERPGQLRKRGHGRAAAPLADQLLQGWLGAGLGRGGARGHPAQAQAAARAALPQRRGEGGVQQERLQLLYIAMAAASRPQEALQLRCALQRGREGCKQALGAGAAAARALVLCQLPQLLQVAAAQRALQCAGEGGGRRLPALATRRAVFSWRASRDGVH
jgi:hypothetical protein